MTRHKIRIRVSRSRIQGRFSRLMQVHDERRHIARELHDSAGQIFTELAMNVSRVAQLSRQGAPQIVQHAEDGMRLVRQLSQEIRTMSYLLHPPLLEEAGLSDAIHLVHAGSLTECS